MSGIYPQLTCKEVKQILKTLGFEPRPRTSASHEQWVKIGNGKLFKVTVDCSKSPFSPDLISSMHNKPVSAKKSFMLL